MRRHIFIYISLFVLIFSCKSNTLYTLVTVVEHSNNNIAYEGRIGKNATNTASQIYWSGTSVKMNFKGTSAKITLEDEKGKNYFNVFIDGSISKVLKLEKGKKTYILASGLALKNHSIEIIKRNEWTYGTTLFYNFEINGRVLEKDTEKSLFIEFYGDSITTGHGNEDYSGDDQSGGEVTNNYNTYAAMTSRNINAEYSCIARGGIGIMVSWFNMIMPEMYYRLNPNDANSKWDFTTKQPDIVVINLFQNDSWIVNQPEHEEFKRRFGDEKPTKEKIIREYSNFIKHIRTEYKNASIVCLLGNMDITKQGSKWPNYITESIKNLNDNNIYTCFVPFKNTPGHPKVEEHEIIANKLTKLIQQKILIK